LDRHLRLPRLQHSGGTGGKSPGLACRKSRSQHRRESAGAVSVYPLGKWQADPTTMGDEEVDLKKRLTETKNPSFEGLFADRTEPLFKINDSFNY
jgi:hypothetical protein